MHISYFFNIAAPWETFNMFKMGHIRHGESSQLYCYYSLLIYKLLS